MLPSYILKWWSTLGFENNSWFTMQCLLWWYLALEFLLAFPFTLLKQWCFEQLANEKHYPYNLGVNFSSWKQIFIQYLKWILLHSNSLLWNGWCFLLWLSTMVVVLRKNIDKIKIDNNTTCCCYNSGTNIHNNTKVIISNKQKNEWSIPGIELTSRDTVLTGRHWPINLTTFSKKWKYQQPHKFWRCNHDAPERMYI